MKIVLVLDRQNGLSAMDFGALSALKGVVGVDFETASGQHQRSVAAVIRVAEPFKKVCNLGHQKGWIAAESVAIPLSALYTPPWMPNHMENWVVCKNGVIHGK